MRGTIIYIVGEGHSGSTLLDFILGSSENAIPINEIKAIKYFIEKKNVKKRGKNFFCSCGNTLQKCPFWSKVIQGVDTNNLFPRNTNTSEKLRLIVGVFFPRKLKRYRHYDDELIYNNIFKTRKEEIIVESSKSFRRMIYLKGLEEIDLKVIHLIRDGRGVINSQYKNAKRREDNRIGDWIGVYLRWLFGNYLISRFAKANIEKKDFIRLSYDSFVQNPQKYLSELNKAFGLKVDLRDYVKKTNETEVHMFAGNQMGRKEIKDIRHDKKWATELPKPKKIILDVLCWLPNKLWVY